MAYTVLTTMKKTALMLLASVALACAQDWDYMQYQLEGINYSVQAIEDKLCPPATGGPYGLDLWVQSLRLHTQQCLAVMASHNYGARAGILVNNRDLRSDADYLMRNYGFTSGQIGEEIVTAAGEYWGIDRERARNILLSYLRAMPAAARQEARRAEQERQRAAARQREHEKVMEAAQDELDARTRENIRWLRWHREHPDFLHL